MNFHHLLILQFSKHFIPWKCISSFHLTYKHRHTDPPPPTHTHFGFDLQALFFPVYNSSSLKPTQVETPKALTMDIKETFVCFQTSTLYHSEFVIWKMRIGTSTSHSNTEDWKSNKKYILCKWHTASIQWTSLLSPTPSPLYSYYIMRETICNY